MRRSLPAILSAALCWTAATFSSANDFKSAIIMGGTSLPSIRIPDDHFMVIRNFTQDGGSSRGVVMVTTSSGTANVLTAAILDSTLEVINTVVIAGPADVTVTCGDGTDCFITYRKDSE